MKSFKFIAALVIAILSFPTHAIDYGETYYQIGGGALTDPSLMQFNSFELELDANLAGRFSCGDFNITESITELVRDLESLPDEFGNYLEVAALDALLGLGAISLQRASPGLYEFLTNSFARHKEFVQLKVASCRRIEEGIQDGTIKDFKDLSKLYTWSRNAQAQTTVQEADAEATGQEGIPWVFDTNAGGVGQDPIRIVADSVIKGYRAKFGGVTITTESDSFYRTEFPTEEDAVEWATQVYGEKTISFEADSVSLAGSGLETAIEQSEEEIRALLNSVLSDPAGASQEDLNGLSTPYFELLPSVLQQINGLPITSRDAVITRLASESAALKEIEKSLFVRSLFVAMLDEPVVYFINKIRPVIEGSIMSIDRQIEDVRRVVQIRREFVGNLVETTMSLSNRSRSNTNTPAPIQNEDRTQDGATIKK